MKFEEYWNKYCADKAEAYFTTQEDYEIARHLAEDAWHAGRCVGREEESDKNIPFYAGEGCMGRKTREAPKMVSYKATLDSSGSAKHLMFEIESFLILHNLKDASIDIVTYPDYYDTVRTELEISYYGPEPKPNGT